MQLGAATAIGLGVAVPHGGHAPVDRAFGTIALSRHGVEFDSFDGKPVDIIGDVSGQPSNSDHCLAQSLSRWKP